MSGHRELRRCHWDENGVVVLVGEVAFGRSLGMGSKDPGQPLVPQLRPLTLRSTAADGPCALTYLGLVLAGQRPADQADDGRHQGDAM